MAKRAETDRKTIINMPVIVKISTPKGDIRVRLYDETPQHRDNFVKLVNEGFYNGTLFHRVIKGFMIQGGDPDSIGAPSGKMLGTGGPGYNVPAEIVYPQLFHKRGALAAARQSDEVNPERESSGSQFYLVYGKVYTPQELKQMEKQMSMQQEQSIFNKLVQQNCTQILELRKARNQAGLQELQDQLIAETKKQMKELPAPKFTPEQQETYTTIGGTPFLDNQYTVFGEVESGMEVVAEIQQCATLSADRPKEDISMTMTIEQ